MLRDRDLVLEHEDRVLLQIAFDDTRLMTPKELARIQALAIGVPAAPKWHVVEERDDWWNRCSVFYGRSITDFDSGGLQSEVNIVGLGFDVSPDLALQVGYAFYEVDDGGGLDSDASWFIGVSLNLYSFRRFGAALLGLKE